MLEQAEDGDALLCLRYAVPDEYKSIDEENNIALHFAVKRGFSEIVTELVETFNADVDAQNFLGSTPLTLAMGNRNFGMIMYLLEYSQKKMDQVLGTLGDSLLHKAARTGLVAVLTQLVEKYSANIMAKNAAGETPLVCALRLGRLDAVNYLLRCPGIKLGRENLHRGKNSLLHVAAEKDFVPFMIDLITSHGADVNATNNKGETPLLLALRGQRLAAVDFLLGCPGIDPDWYSIQILSGIRQEFERRGEDFRSEFEQPWLRHYANLAAMIEKISSAANNNTLALSPPQQYETVGWRVLWVKHGIAGWRVLWVLSVMVVFVACFVTFSSGWLQSSSP